MLDSFIKKNLERFTRHGGYCCQSLVGILTDAERLVFIFWKSRTALGSAASMLVSALRKSLALFWSDFLRRFRIGVMYGVRKS